jgi:hypothetical protein
MSYVESTLDDSESDATGGSAVPARTDDRLRTAATVEERDRLNMLLSLARLTTSTEMVPKALRGRPNAALAVMVYGHEMGLQPMTSLREIFIIEGTPSCSAKLMRSLIFRNGHTLEFREASRERVTIYGKRCDGQGEATVTWDLEDAKIAGLLGKDNWKKYPRSMLTARATSELARLIFPDTQIGYTPEELGRVDLSGEYDYVDVEEVDPPLGDVGSGDLVDVQDAEWVRAAREGKEYVEQAIPFEAEPIEATDG